MYISQAMKALRINPSNLEKEAEYLRTRPVQWITPNHRNYRLVKGDYVLYTETYVSGGTKGTTVYDWRPIAVYSGSRFNETFGKLRGYHAWYHIKP